MVPRTRFFEREVVMTDLEIRAAREADVPVILALIRELAEYEKLTDQVVVTAGSLRQRLFGEGRVADAALGYCRGEPVAYAVWYPTFSTFSGEAGFYLEDVFVKQDYRGRGYGRAMLRHLARVARRRGFGKVSWAVLDWNRSAIGFYRSLGARPAPREWLGYALDGEALADLAQEV